MRLPALVINCKAYPQATGKNALSFARKCERVAAGSGVPVILCVQACDIGYVAGHVRIPVFAQHVDAEPGAHTGNIVLESVLAAGAQGTLLNHAERPLPLSTIKKTIAACKRRKFPVIACAATLAQARRIALLRPACIAVEPPGLIGSGISVSVADPSLIRRSVALPVPVLCGAGIHSKTDVRAALALGAAGVLVASAVVQTRYQQRVIAELAAGFS